MQKKANGHSILKSISNLLLIVIQHWATITLFYLSIWGFLSTHLSQLQKQGNITTTMLRLLIIELGLSALALIFSTICIIKFCKNEPKLPPKKDIKNIIKLTSKYGAVDARMLFKKFGFTSTKSKYYFTLLKDAKFMKCTYKIDNSENKKFPEDVEITFALDKKGLEYAIKHNLD